LANAVPVRIQFWLNIDFVRGSKIHPGGKFPLPCGARQKLPDRENFAYLARQILPLFIKATSRKVLQTLEKTCFTPGHDKVNKYEESVAPRLRNRQRYRP
jgi:hypothetical protein